jgi:hypothetical protein
MERKMSIAQNYPAISPSLNLSFALTKALDPRITFTRASTAAYYDGVTTAKAEENLLTFSEQFDDAAWAISGTTVVANTTIAPNGATTADSLSDNTNNVFHFIQRGALGQIGFNTVSLYVKKNTLNFAMLSFGTVFSAGFDLNTGVIVETNGAGVTSTITPVGNDWYRISLTATLTTVQNINIYTSLDGVFANRVYTGSGNSLFLWGAQLEQRSAVTSYTPTTTQPITNYVPVLETAASGQARFDHNPTTFESLGLLIEEQRTNLFTRSDDFANATWNKTRSSVISNIIVAPDGTLTGDKLVEDTTASNNHQTSQLFNATSGTTYTATAYFKAAERGFGAISLGDNAFTTTQVATVNLSTGAASVIIGTATATSSAVGNGWYRVSITAAATSTETALVRLYTSNSASDLSTTGDGYSGIYIWGAQLEAGAFPTSYIPTIASQVTRAADAASMTGVNFSSWYNQAEGTFYGEFIPVVAASQTMFTVSDNTANNRILAGYTTSMLNANERVVYNGADQANYFSSFSGSLQVGQPAKLSTVYKTNDFALALNNGTVATDTQGNTPVVDRLYIVASFSGATSNMYLRKLSYYPRRLANSELQGLTS